MSIPLSTLPLLALLAASCAPESGTTPPQPETLKPLSQRLNESNGYKQDASGNWVPKTDKRSSFEAQGASPYFKGRLEKNTYKTGDYSKKSWWGGKNYERQSYAGNTDGSRFRKASAFDGANARETGGTAEIPDSYQTGTYSTSAAREAGSKRIAKPSDAETDIRRGVYPQPEIIDWRQQRSITLEQSRGILGR